MEENSGVVIDNGSYNIKAGFGGDSAPRSLFRTVVGKTRNAGISIAMGERSYRVGESAQKNRGLLNLTYPIQGGKVVDWDDMEKVWHYTFYEALKVAPEEHPSLLTDAPGTSANDREKMLTTMIETFGVPSVSIVSQAVTALYSSGRTSGCVVDMGSQKSFAVPIFEGYTLPHSTHKVNVNGEDITKYLHKLLTARGYAFTTIAELDLVREMKEALCYVAKNYKSECASVSEDPRPFEKSFELPDGSKVHLAKERFQCAEAIFQPHLLGKTNDAGICESVVQTIKSCSDIRDTLLENIVLSGGNSMFPGVTSRLVDGIIALDHKSKPKVYADPARSYTSWIGSSILSSLPTFGSMRVTKSDFEEHGAAVVHRKCL
jgi:actin-related protein